MPKSFGFGASESRPYVVHFCKNKACYRAFLDIDRRDAKEPPRSHYCPDCKAQGLRKRKKAQFFGA